MTRTVAYAVPVSVARIGDSNLGAEATGIRHRYRD